MAEFIGVKQLHKDLKEIARRVEKGEEFVVAKHNKPLFMITSYTHDKKGQKQYTLKDLEGLQFHSDTENASQRVDDVVYGA